MFPSHRIDSGAALLQRLPALLLSHACFHLVSSSSAKPTSPGVFLMVGISHRELSVVATTESVKMAQQRRQTNEFGLACGVVIFTICEIPARERERDGVLISMKLRGEKT